MNPVATEDAIRELDAALESAADEYITLAQHAAQAAHAFKKAEARAYLTAEGSIETRKRKALLDCEAEHIAHLSADAALDAAGRVMGVIRARLDAQRTLAANQREMSR